MLPFYFCLWNGPLIEGQMDQHRLGDGDCLTVEGATNKRRLQIYGPGRWEEKDGRTRSEKVLRVKKIVYQFFPIQRPPNGDAWARNADSVKSMASQWGLSPCLQQLAVQSDLGRAAVSFAAWQVKPMKLPMFRPEKLHRFIGQKLDTSGKNHFCSQDLKVLSSILRWTFPLILVSLKSGWILSLMSAR